MLKVHNEFLSELIITKKSIIHCARHLEKIDDQLLSKYDLHSDQLETRKLSSFFKSDFANSPNTIIEKSKRHASCHRFERVSRNKIEIEMDFDISIFPKGIGLDGIISRSNLSKSEIDFSTVEFRNGFEVKVVKLTRQIPTNHLTIISHFNGLNWELTTLFPGTFAPPLPIAPNDPNLYFWNDHFFVEYL